MMKHVLIILCLTLAMGATHAKVASQALPAQPANTPPAAIERAPLQLLYFTASWCGPCQMMKTQTWPDPRVVAALQQYQFTTIDVDKQAKLAKKWSVRAMPSYVLTDPSGTIELTRTSGFMDAHSMTTWLNEVFETAYTSLEQQRAAQVAFATHWQQLDALYQDDLSDEAYQASRQALFTLLAMRNRLEPTSAEKLEILLVNLAETKPARLVDGMLHPDIQVRAKIARVLRADGQTFDPWATPQAREAAVNTYKARESLQLNQQ